MDFFENKFFLLAITFGFFFLSKLLQKKTGWVLLNPILVAIAMLICFLQFTGVSYETYSEAGSLVEFWLKPAVVALGVPLYLQLRMIKKQLMPILIFPLSIMFLFVSADRKVEKREGGRESSLVGVDYPDLEGGVTRIVYDSKLHPAGTFPVTTVEDSELDSAQAVAAVECSELHSGDCAVAVDACELETVVLAG